MANKEFWANFFASARAGWEAAHPSGFPPVVQHAAPNVLPELRPPDAPGVGHGVSREPCHAQPPEGPNELVSRKRAAELLDMDPRTFDVRVRPRIKDHGFGGRPKYRVQDVLAALEHCAAQPPQPVHSPKPPPAAPIHRRRLAPRRRRSYSTVRRDIRRLIGAMQEHTRGLYAVADSFERAKQAMATDRSAGGKTPPPHLVSSERGREILAELDDE